VIVVMGVTGSGKTTVGRLLAGKLRVPFVDADNFHTTANIDRMRHGEPLRDEDREPWLDRLNAELRQHTTSGAVLACSALTGAYRARLAQGVAGVRFVLLTAPPDVIRARVEQRKGHFAPAELLESQLALLDPPKDAIVIDVEDPPGLIVERLVKVLQPAR